MRDVFAPDSGSCWLRQLRRVAMLPLLGAVAVAGLILTGCVSSGPSPAASEGRGYVGSGGASADAASAPVGRAPRAPAKSASGSSGGVVTDIAPASTPGSATVERPGLGTAWGESRESQLSYTQFVRASTSPSAVSSVYYNSEAAIRDLVGSNPAYHGFMSADARGGVEWRVQAGGGLPWWQYSNRRYVAGREGERYTLVVRNNNSFRVEAVLTVDGLDVMDGKSGSYRKRGYIIEPGDTLTVDGFRQSTQAVAAFRFSSIGGSYANLRHGDTRNVGVIGLAVFEPVHAYRGDSANPFPDSRYAQPPARR